jgi:hypothetical protein
LYLSVANLFAELPLRISESEAMIKIGTRGPHRAHQPAAGFKVLWEETPKKRNLRFDNFDFFEQTRKPNHKKLLQEEST